MNHTWLLNAQICTYIGEMDKRIIYPTQPCIPGNSPGLKVTIHSLW